jgi:hypothetical protein
MEQERKLFAEEASQQLKRHKTLIDKLCKENDTLKEELVQNTQAKRDQGKAPKNDFSGGAQTAEEIRILKERIEDERQQQERMEDDIKRI